MIELVEVKKTKDVLYVGLVEGRDYKGLGVPPSAIAGIDSSLEKTIEVAVTTELVKIEGILYENVIAEDEHNNIVYAEISKF